jgi:uncharacterized protein (DUF2225 family)
MSTTQSPLVSSPIKCPVCNTVTPQTTTKTGAYRVNAKDTDFRPSEVIWTNSEYQKHDPLLFFMATCPRCFYTHEYTDEFKAWENDFSFVTYTRAVIAQKHLTALQDKNGLIRFLGPRIDPDKYPTETAIIKIILGIYDELQLTQPSALNLARYFLRIAWLFRGRTQSTNAVSSGQGYDSFGNFEEFLVEAKQRFAEIPTNEQEALATASVYYRNAFERGSQVADGVAQVQAAYLIAEISRRAGDFATADRYFLTTMKIGRELTHDETATAASINQTERLLATAVEQARLSKQAQQQTA